MNDIVLGAIIGGGGTILGGIIGTVISYYLDKKKCIREGRKKVYKDVQLFIVDLTLNKTQFLSVEGKKRMNEIGVDVALFCSHKICDLFSATTQKISSTHEISVVLEDKDIDNNLDKILCLMRSDLGTENKYLYRLKHLLLK